MTIDENGNLGNRNEGDQNHGNQNHGDQNHGYKNNGDHNIGEQNFGNHNQGDQNCGNHNFGDQNVGDRNVGYYNYGSQNIGHYNYTQHAEGCFNTQPTGEYSVFNKPYDGYLYFSTLPLFLRKVQLTTWIPEQDMTDDEKAKHRSYKNCGGYLQLHHYKEAIRKAWDEATTDDRRAVLALPNWDNDIFKEITGIDVEKELQNQSKTTLPPSSEETDIQTKIDAVLQSLEKLRSHLASASCYVYPDMTEDEKRDYLSYKTCRGYLRGNDYKEAIQSNKED